MIKKGNGFSLIELLVVVAIIGLLSTIVLTATSGLREKARDSRRKTELGQIGRLSYSSRCYIPNTGVGDYDIADLVPELVQKYPDYSQFISLLPKDPKTGTNSQTNYRYNVTSDDHCVVYANLENDKEKVTLPGNVLNPALGQGIWKSLTNGPNGSPIYYQIGR